MQRSEIEALRAQRSAGTAGAGAGADFRGVSRDPRAPPLESHRLSDAGAVFTRLLTR